MGNCCSGENQRDKEVNMARDYHGTNIPANLEHLFNDKDVLGLKGADKIYIIVRLQAFFRGAIVRKRIRQRYGF